MYKTIPSMLPFEDSRYGIFNIMVAIQMLTLKGV